MEIGRLHHSVPLVAEFKEAVENWNSSSNSNSDTVIVIVVVVLDKKLLSIRFIV
jgi:hypothetical protein